MHMASLGNCNSKSSTSSGTPVTRFDKNQCTGTRVLVFVPGLKYLLVLTIPGVLQRTTVVYYNFSLQKLWTQIAPFALEGGTGSVGTSPQKTCVSWKLPRFLQSVYRLRPYTTNKSAIVHAIALVCETPVTLLIPWYNSLSILHSCFLCYR